MFLLPKTNMANETAVTTGAHLAPTDTSDLALAPTAKYVAHDAGFKDLSGVVTTAGEALQAGADTCAAAGTYEELTHCCILTTAYSCRAVAVQQMNEFGTIHFDIYR